MTGTTERKDAPRTDTEWARDQQRRMDLAEHPDALRAGQWVLTTGAGGDLVGSHVDGGSAVLLPRPTPGVDPESVTDSALPSVCVTRTAIQSIAAGGEPVIFDGVASAVGDWRTDGGQVAGVQVPESGVYDLSSTVWYAVGGAVLRIMILVDGRGGRIGASFLDQTGTTWISLHACGQLYLNAGETVALWPAPGATRNIGASTVFSPAIPTSLSLSMTSRG